MVLSQPAQQTDEACVNPQDISADGPVLLLEFKGRPFGLICKYAAGMVLPVPAAVIQNKHGLLRGGSRLAGAVYRIGALGLLFLFGCIAEIKYRHDNPP